MKHIIHLIAAIFFCTALFGQTGKVSFSGHLATREKVRSITLQNFDNIKISIPVHAHNAFSFADTLPNGFYEVDSIGTVYFAPGYSLVVQQEQEGAYRFTGIGALENNALRAAKQAPFIASDKTAKGDTTGSGELEPYAYSLGPKEFLQKIDSLQYRGERLFNRSVDSFFSKYAALDLKFYEIYLCQLYFIQNVASQGGQLTTAGDSSKVLTKMLKDAARMSGLVGRIYSNWDRNDETLFRNSSWYRQAFQSFFSYKCFSLKYIKQLTSGMQQASPGEMILRRDLVMSQVARDEISNPYIQSYFDYTCTRSIMQDAKDTALLNKYYREYLGRSSRPDYQAAIKEIYDNAISYTDNEPAPSFSYRNNSDKLISLNSLLGKYIYIDVWATWCGPCKAEIPHLKEVEAAYQDKQIAFVSISVDEQQDTKKWKAFVQQEDLKGIQLIADSAFESAFIRKMGIHAIPRFILIDPTGKIIAADALRPSNKELRTTLDKLL